MSIIQGKTFHLVKERQSECDVSLEEFYVFAIKVCIFFKKRKISISEIR